MTDVGLLVPSHIQDEEDKKGLLSRNMPKKQDVNTGIESMADYVLSIRKAFNDAG